MQYSEVSSSKHKIKSRKVVKLKRNQPEISLPLKEETKEEAKPMFAQSVRNIIVPKLVLPQEDTE